MKWIEQVRLAQQGDADAQTALYEQTYKRVYYLALRMTGSAQDAEDAAQETFLSAFRALPNLSDPNAFEGWLFQIAANKCRNVLRKEGKYTDLPQDEDGNTMLDQMPEEDEALIPAEALEQQDQREIILSMVQSLPEDQRECVLLFYYAQLSVKQIAQSMGCSEGTIKSRLNYARKKLKESILETEARDGIRLHTLAPLGLLFLSDFRETTSHLTVAALGGAAGAAGAAGGAAAGSGTAAGVGGKVGLFAAAKAKVVAGITAAALAAGGGAVLLSQQPKAIAFSDPAMEANLRVLLDQPDGPIYPADVEELYALYIFDDGMATDSAMVSQPVDQAWNGTQAVSSLTDLDQLSQLAHLYYAAEDITLLDTLDPLPQLETLLVTGEEIVLSDLSFLEEVPGVRNLSLPVQADMDLSPINQCTQLQKLFLRSEGGLSLSTNGLDQLVELTLLCNWLGMQPDSKCTLEVPQPLPQLLCLWLNGGNLDSLELLHQTPALQSLELYATNLEQLDLSPVGTLQQLRCINLMGSYNMTLDLAPLASCSALEVWMAPNGTILNPPPQAVQDTDSSLPLYNQVQNEIYDRIAEACTPSES